MMCMKLNIVNVLGILSDYLRLFGILQNEIFWKNSHLRIIFVLSD